MMTTASSTASSAEPPLSRVLHPAAIALRAPFRCTSTISSGIAHAPPWTRRTGAVLVMKRSKETGQFSIHLHRSEEHTSELQSRGHLVCRLLLEKKNKHIT